MNQVEIPTKKIKKWERVEDVPVGLCLTIDGKQLKYKLVEE